jgi:hypothetical protein
MSFLALNNLITKTARRVGRVRRLELPCDLDIVCRKEFSSIADEDNSKWKTWFRSHEYQPIWTPSPFENMSSKGQSHCLSDVSLDNASKCLLLYLDDITYCRDTNRRLDVPTTTECNNMIKKLNAFMNERKEFNRASHRSYLIWKKMEHCMDIRRDIRHNSVKSQFYYSLPVPNRETYMEVLSAQAQVESILNGENMTGSAQERAMDVARKMEEKYDEGNWEAKPDVAVWNQVLASWAHSSHPEKSLEAAKLMKIKIGDNVDASSFGNVFKACATTKGDNRAVQLAGRVALRVWDDFKKSPLASPSEAHENKQLLERGSYMIVFALKSLQLLKDRAVKNETIKSQFDTACHLGLINNHVLLALKSIASDKILKDLLGNHVGKEVEAIYHLIPTSWKINAKANASGW